MAEQKETIKATHIPISLDDLPVVSSVTRDWPLQGSEDGGVYASAAAPAARPEAPAARPEAPAATTAETAQDDPQSPDFETIPEVAEAQELLRELQQALTTITDEGIRADLAQTIHTLEAHLRKIQEALANEERQQRQKSLAEVVEEWNEAKNMARPDGAFPATEAFDPEEVATLADMIPVSVSADSPLKNAGKNETYIRGKVDYYRQEIIKQHLHEAEGFTVEVRTRLRHLVSLLETAERDGLIFYSSTGRQVPAGEIARSLRTYLDTRPATGFGSVNDKKDALKKISTAAGIHQLLMRYEEMESSADWQEMLKRAAATSPEAEFGGRVLQKPVQASKTSGPQAGSKATQQPGFFGRAARSLSRIFGANAGT